MLNLTQMVGCGILSVYALLMGGAFITIRRNNRIRSIQQERVYSGD